MSNSGSVIYTCPQCRQKTKTLIYSEYLDSNVCNHCYGLYVDLDEIDWSEL